MRPIECCRAGPYYAPAHDWTHANGLEYSAERDSYLLSLGGINSVLEASAGDGHVLWIRQGERVHPAEAAFSLAHDATWTDEGTVLLFANEGPQRPWSWVAELEVFHDGLREVWTGGMTDTLYTSSHGHALRPTTGNTLLAYGQTGVIRELDEDDVLVREIVLGTPVTLMELALIDDFVVR